MAEQQATTGRLPPPDAVAEAFVHQYYYILHQSPELVHRFYQDISKLGRPEENGVIGITSTMQAINEKILSLGQFTANIVTIDAQESYNGGVLVLVTGYLTGRDNIRRKFTQSFFLAPQDKGYFVLNDILRYVQEPTLLVAVPGLVNHVAEPSYEQNPTPVQDNHYSEHITSSLEETEQEEVYNPSENGDALEEEIPVTEVADEIPVDEQIVGESNIKCEDVPKKSYASIVKDKKESFVQVPTSNVALKAIAQKSQEQHLIASPPPPTPVPAAPTSDSQVSSAKATDASGQEANGNSIYLKGLPLEATYSQVESECSRFGPIKPGGIQIRINKGFCFGFVEFELRSAAESAIEASSITVGGRQVAVEPKRSTFRGIVRERFPSVRAGYRNGPRGRGGNYGGGGNRSRGEMVNYRIGGRGGYPNRGGEEYHRGADDNGGGGGYYHRGADDNGGGGGYYHRGDDNNGGGRPHRASGFNSRNGPTKNMAPGSLLLHEIDSPSLGSILL